MKKEILKKVLALGSCLAFVLTFLPAASLNVQADESLTYAGEASSYGFFTWLSNNTAASADEREDAKVAAEILKNNIEDKYKDPVFNDGTIIGGSTSITYAQLLGYTDIGAENDATTLENLREAVNFVIKGNEYRAKENLSPLKIASGMMAMSELNTNYIDNHFDHTDNFMVLENIAGAYVEGTWKYGTFPGASNDPYESWYTKEKANYDSNNGETGHYKTLTDRQGTMLLTGFGVGYSYINGKLTASDGKEYDVTEKWEYYSQTFSDDNNEYYVGSGTAPENYLRYVNEYYCQVKGHTWKQTKVITEPTCTEAGEKFLTCSICGETKTEAIPAVGHDMVKAEGKAASCTEDGYEAYYKCARCGKLFNDENGQSEISSPSVIKAAGHKWDAGRVTKPATCISKGVKTYTCSACGKTREEDIQIDPNNHAGGTQIKGKTAAACIEKGYTGDTYCKGCGACIKKGAVIPAAGHSWDNGSVTLKPTMNNTGVRTYTCKNCGKIKTEILPALPAIAGNNTPASSIDLKGASEEQADQAIQVSKDDSDIRDARFDLLQLRSKKVSKNSVGIRWNIISGAEKYIVYSNMCGSKYKKYKTLTGNALTQKGLKKGTYYKYLVVAVNGSGDVISTSKTVHIATRGGKVCNVKKLQYKNVRHGRLSLKKGKTFQLKTKYKKEYTKLSLKNHRRTAYESSDSSIAAVSSKGVVKAIRKGTCYIYAYAQNGVYAKTRLTVK